MEDYVMATNPRNALKSFARLDQQRKDDAKIDYQLKVVKAIAKQLEIDMTAVMNEYHSLRDSNPELFLEAIKEANTGFPEELFIENRHPIKFEGLALKAHESYWFTRFLKTASENDVISAGLIFPVMGRKDWIIHNLSVSPTPGKVRLLIPSKSEGIDNVHITPLVQFLEEFTT
jgi:hypothetical protein